MKSDRNGQGTEKKILKNARISRAKGKDKRGYWINTKQIKMEKLLKANACIPSCKDKEIFNYMKRWQLVHW